MAAIVASVGALLEAQFLPVLVDRVAQGARCCRLRVGAAQHLLAEVRPCELPGVPLDLVVVDAGARGCELVPHAHVEAVDDEDVANLAAIEATAKLQQVDILLQLGPPGFQLRGADAQLSGRVHGIQDHAVLQGIAPRETKGFLEGFLRLGLHREGGGLQLHGLGGNRPVVRVDELLLVDALRGDCALGQDAYAVELKLQLHQLLDLVADGVGLDEDEGRVPGGAVGKVLLFLRGASEDLERSHAFLQLRDVRAGLARFCRCGCGLHGRSLCSHGLLGDWGWGLADRGILHGHRCNDGLRRSLCGRGCRCRRPLLLGHACEDLSGRGGFDHRCHECPHVLLMLLLLHQEDRRRRDAEHALQV
mmetsp:Transcript_71867/g.222888  ORF Transcript_71867/g.222888 Transcript_71867/m.222888 type:complete len:362 (-) Transcript_71867:122-1207(-)